MVDEKRNNAIHLSDSLMGSQLRSSSSAAAASANHASLLDQGAGAQGDEGQDGDADVNSFFLILAFVNLCVVALSTNDFVHKSDSI